MRLGGHERFGASGVARLLTSYNGFSFSPAHSSVGICFGNLTRKARGDLCLNILNTSPLKTIVTPDRGSAHFRSKFEACLLDTMLNFQLAFEDMRRANLHLVRLAQRLGDLCLAGSFDVLI